MEEAFAVFVEAFATITLGAIFVGGNFQLSGGHLSRVQMSGEQYFSGAIIRRAII